MTLCLAVSFGYILLYKKLSQNIGRKTATLTSPIHKPMLETGLSGEDSSLLPMIQTGGSCVGEQNTFPTVLTWFAELLLSRVPVHATVSAGYGTSFSVVCLKAMEPRM